MKKNFTEIEEIIESRIAELEKEYDLDHYDIEDIRLEAYWENGWSGDPFPLDEEEEEEDEEDSELSPVQVYLIKDTDYACVKILGSDESGDIMIPLYLDLDSMELPDSDREPTNNWAWLRFL